MHNLRDCVQAAVSVISSASTVMGLDNADQNSEFGDLFPPRSDDAMLNWMSSTPLDGNDEHEASGISDSDGELEEEIIQSLFRIGKEKLALQDFDAAERHLRNCLGRIDRTLSASTTSLHRLSVSRSEIVTLLLSIYRQQSRWDEAHALLADHIQTESQNSSNDKYNLLADTLTLVEILLNKSAHAEALLDGRRALKGYRKMGPEGRDGVGDSLKLLCQICNASGNRDEEDAYTAILGNALLKRTEPSRPSTIPTTAANGGDSIPPGLNDPKAPVVIVHEQTTQAVANKFNDPEEFSDTLGDRPGSRSYRQKERVGDSVEPQIIIRPRMQKPTSRTPRSSRGSETMVVTSMRGFQNRGRKSEDQYPEYPSVSVSEGVNLDGDKIPDLGLSRERIVGKRQRRRFE